MQYIRTMWALIYDRKTQIVQFSLEVILDETSIKHNRVNKDTAYCCDLL